jgi:hypothetical protein
MELFGRPMVEDTENQKTHASAEGFDLDAFFEGFDFDAAQKRLDERKQAEKAPARSIAPKGAASAQSGAAAASSRLDDTMSYARAGEAAPELPFADKSLAHAGGKGPGHGMRISSQAAGTTRENAAVAAAQRDRQALPDGRQAGRQAGQPAGLPDGRQAGQERGQRQGGQERAQQRPTHPQARPQPRPQATRREAQMAGRSAQAAGRRAQQQAAMQPPPARREAVAPAKRAQLFAQYSRPCAIAAQGAISTIDDASLFTPASRQKPSYRIRGGGAGHVKSPILTIFSGLVVAIGIVALGFLLYQAVTTIPTLGATESITLTATETRSAISERIPKLSGLIHEEFEAVESSARTEGASVFSNPSYRADAPGIVSTPETPAVAHEIVYLPKNASESFITGYYEGSYNAYSPVELQDFFNGAWVLDMARGEIGTMFKMRYVNLNATGIADEMDWLAAFQGLDGDGATVSARGRDPRGNDIVQGTVNIDGTIYYWKIAACNFNEVYSAKRIPSTGVYISCSFATYDFYTGGDKITPA